MVETARDRLLIAALECWREEYDKRQALHEVFEAKCVELHEERRKHQVTEEQYVNLRDENLRLLEALRREAGN
jgi:hypothetical protein